MLDLWPALSIAVHYGGPQELDHLTSEDEDNIMDALSRPHRVHSINLTITSALVEKLAAINGTFPELEKLVLLSRESTMLTLPSTFWYSSCLRCLHLTGVTSTSLKLARLLRSSTNLVDLQLHEVLNPRYFSPKSLTIVLSRMSQLRSLSLHFLYRRLSRPASIDGGTHCPSRYLSP